MPAARQQAAATAWVEPHGKPPQLPLQAGSANMDEAQDMIHAGPGQVWYA